MKSFQELILVAISDLDTTNASIDELESNNISATNDVEATHFKVPLKTNDDFIMANGETLPITTLKAGVYQLYNPI